MRLSAFRFQPRAIDVGEFQRGTVVDRRPSLGQQPLALELQLLRRLIARVEPAGRDQGIARGIVFGQPVGLAFLAIPAEAQPLQVVLDGCLELGLAAQPVGIVEPQDERAAMAPREQPVEQGRPDIADMQEAGRAGREADNRRDFGAAVMGGDLWRRPVGGSSALRYCPP